MEHTADYKLFTYSWHLDDEIQDVTIVRCYCLDASNKNVCLTITGFNPYMYLELPEKNIKGDPVHWDSATVAALGQALSKEGRNEQQPVHKLFCKRKKLYGAHLKADNSPKFFPYLQCAFNCKRDLRFFSYKCKRPVEVLGLGKVQLRVHDTDASEVLQITSNRNIPTAGWISCSGVRETPVGRKITKCDYELSVNWKNIDPLGGDLKQPSPLVMGFDIEVYSSNPSAMPDASKPADEIFQISCVFWREGDEMSKIRKFLLTLGDPDIPRSIKDFSIRGEMSTGPTGENRETDDSSSYLIQTYNTEAALLLGFTDLVNKENPNVISGYNIMCFDIPYMIERAKTTYCFEFLEMGFTNRTCKEKQVKWSSSAYRNQEFKYLDTEGRIFIDLLPLIKRDYKMDNYKLKTISNFFLGKTKDPLSVKGIFRCYDLGVKNIRALEREVGECTEKERKVIAKGNKVLGICGKYCVQDSVLVVELMSKLNTWNGLTQMATVCNIPIISTYTQGQQVKVFSQIYKYCIGEKIVVEKDGYKAPDSERYMGALVYDPDPGTYDMVVPLDFSSLYPSVIRAYNICYSTWVTDESIPDELCHVMKWEEHVFCSHDPKFQRLEELSTYIDKTQAKLKRLRERKKTITKDKEALSRLSREIEEIVVKLKPYQEERAEIQKSRPKTATCAKRYYRFLKEPKGVLPTVIQNLIDARNHTRKVEMAAVYDEIDALKSDLSIPPKEKEQKISDLKGKLGVLDKKQLAYKVSGNSMYGALGVREGYLPFMPGAMVTTFMGRQTITKAIEAIKSSYRCQFVYSDTDSTYLSLDCLVKEGYTQAQIWDYATQMADEVSKLFPSPIKLEFEKVLYPFFCILTKKKYIYKSISSRDGEVDKKLGSKGVLLSRRDNALFVRNIYNKIAVMLADRTPAVDIEYWLIQQINVLFSRGVPVTEFVITKAVNDVGDLKPEPTTNDKGKAKLQIGDYSINPLPLDEAERMAYLVQNGFADEREYYISCLPAHIQLAEKIKSRGERVDVGTRLEYVVTNPHMVGFKWKLSDKIEALDYFQRHSDVLQIDYFYYSEALVNPVDQLLDAAFSKQPGWVSGVVARQHKFRLKVREPVIKAIKSLSKPIFTKVD